MERLSEPTQKRIPDVDHLNGMIESGLTIMGNQFDAVDGPDGIYLSSELPDKAYNIEVKSVKERGELGQGANDSHHQVTFGEVQYQKENGDNRSIPVAIKNYDDAAESAVLEFQTLIAIGRLGFETLQPLALAKEGNTTYLITRFRPDILSLDNENWTTRPGEEGYSDLAENLQFIGKTMATMHGRGVFRGDEQPKNYVRSDVGNPVVLDLEAGSIIYDNKEDFIQAFNGHGDIEESKAYTDIKTLWRTLNRPIGLREENIFLGADASSEEIYDTFLNHFVIPYARQLEIEIPHEILSQLELEKLLSTIDDTVRTNLRLPDAADA
jgi:hypothetical protein